MKRYILSALVLFIVVGSLVTHLTVNDDLSAGQSFLDTAHQCADSLIHPFAGIPIIFGKSGIQKTDESYEVRFYAIYRIPVYVITIGSDGNNCSLVR